MGYRKRKTIKQKGKGCINSVHLSTDSSSDSSSDGEIREFLRTRNNRRRNFARRNFTTQNFTRRNRQQSITNRSTRKPKQIKQPRPKRTQGGTTKRKKDSNGNSKGHSNNTKKIGDQTTLSAPHTPTRKRSNSTSSNASNISKLQSPITQGIPTSPYPPTPVRNINISTIPLVVEGIMQSNYRKYIKRKEKEENDEFDTVESLLELKKTKK